MQYPLNQGAKQVCKPPYRHRCESAVSKPAVLRFDVLFIPSGSNLSANGDILIFVSYLLICVLGKERRGNAV